MLWLAIKTLLHERVRFLITLLGITISAILTLVEIAIFLGMMGNATAVIRHTDADIWIASKNIQSFDFALPFPEERINKVRALPDVLWADKILLNYGFIKLANGGREQIQIIGYDPDTGIGAPWSLIEGKASEVKGGRRMIIDKTSEKRLGSLMTGTQWELTVFKEHTFRLVGISDGIKSFTTIPLVFMSYNEFNRLFAEAGLHDQVSFIVAKLGDQGRLKEVIRSLRASLKDNDVFTRDEFIRKTILYWTVQTGMGMAFFLTAILATVIGSTIVGQMIYASTLEHLREYGTLKAIGAKNWEIYQVVFSQAVISSVSGYGLAISIVLLLKRGIIKAGVPLYLSATLFVVLFFVTLLACFASAYFSVSKIRTFDPVTVFKA